MGEEGGLDRNRGRSDSERRRGAGNIDRRGGQMMQDLTDLAAVSIVSELQRGCRLFEDWYGQAPGEGQIVVVPTKQDGLKQNGEKAEPRGQA